MLSSSTAAGMRSPAPSGGVPALHLEPPRPAGPPSAGPQRGVGLPQALPEGAGGVVVEQRVDHAVGGRQAQRHHHAALQGHGDAAAPAAAHGVQVQRPDQVIGQKAEQEGRRHHGNQLHRAPPVAGASRAGQVAAAGAGVGRELADDVAVADDDGEEGQEEAEGHGHVVQDQEARPGGRGVGLEAAGFPLPEGQRDTRNTGLCLLMKEPRRRRSEPSDSPQCDFLGHLQ